MRGRLWGIVRCEKLSPNDFSVHAEGRALDWHLDARKPKERAAAMRLIHALLASDDYGRAHALAPRMGIQGIIFDCRSWWSGMGRARRVLVLQGQRQANPTQAHRDHIHLELSWPGARKETSFWHSPPAV